MDKKVKNMFEYLTLVSEDVAKQLEVEATDVLPILQKRLNPYDPKPKDTFNDFK